MVIVTNYSGDLPDAILILPEVNEPCFAYWLGFIRVWVLKTMDTYFHRAITFHWVHFKRPWNKLPAHFAADIVLNGLNQALL